MCKDRLGAVPNFLQSQRPALASTPMKQSWVLLLTTRSIGARGAKSNAILNGIKSRTLSKSRENGDTPTVPHSSQTTGGGFRSGQHTFLRDLYNGLQSQFKRHPTVQSGKSPFYPVPWPPSLLHGRQTMLPVSLFPSKTIHIYKQINVYCPPLLLHKW